MLVSVGVEEDPVFPARCACYGPNELLNALWILFEAPPAAADQTAVT